MKKDNPLPPQNLAELLYSRYNELTRLKQNFSGDELCKEAKKLLEPIKSGIPDSKTRPEDYASINTAYEAIVAQVMNWANGERADCTSDIAARVKTALEELEKKYTLGQKYAPPPSVEKTPVNAEIA